MIASSTGRTSSVFFKALMGWQHGLRVLLMALILVSCSEEEISYDPKVLRIAVLPDESNEQLQSRHQPLAEYLAAALGIDYTLIIPDSYDQLDQLFSDGNVDLAYFGGVTFVRAHVMNGAQSVVMRDIDAIFTSTFLVRSDNPATDIADLKGESFAFGSKLSTSGHLMPRSFMLKDGIVPERFFGDVKYSGAHDTTAKWVRDGFVTSGVANSRVIERMFDSGQLQVNQVRILSRTPPYPDYVWALNKNISEDFKVRLQRAFLSLSMVDPESRVILEHAHTKGFLPVRSSDFKELEIIVRSLGLLRSAS